MSLAQQLYEAGHITYMRTDGVSLAPAAVDALRDAVQAQYGPEYVPAQPRVYKARTKNAQVWGDSWAGGSMQRQSGHLVC